MAFFAITARGNLRPEFQPALVVRFSYHLSGRCQRRAVLYQMVRDMNNLKFHPVADLFPLMQGSELDDLIDDIRKQGLLEPIWLYGGRVLDGRNRLRACNAVGVEPQFREYEGDDPVGFVVSLNLHRRHLSESQRSMVGCKLATLEAGDNQYSKRGRANLPDLSNGQAADLMNVSERSIKSAKKVNSQGITDLVQKVESGDVKVSVAADIATLPENQQEVIVSLGEKAILRAAKEIRSKKARVRQEESSFEVDTKQASDLVVMRANGVTVACRVRRPEYYKYRYDFTIRSMRDSGAETEQVKIYNGWADWMFYGHAGADCDAVERPGFRAWMLLNLDSYRSQMITYQNQIVRSHRSNRDGTYFNIYDVRSFKPHPPLVIASQGIFTAAETFRDTDTTARQAISHCPP